MSQHPEGKVIRDMPGITAGDSRSKSNLTRHLQAWLREKLATALSASNLEDLKSSVQAIRSQLETSQVSAEKIDIYRNDFAYPTIAIESVLSDLEQILAVRTMERAKYYMLRLQKSTVEVKTNGINDINLNRWKDYGDIYTDSLWLFPKRDRSGAHNAWYWGNFAPQIPHQLMLRYTRKGDWVIDMFAGSGTTLIEAMNLDRNSVGVELNPDIAIRTKNLIDSLGNASFRPRLIIDDSTSVNTSDLLRISGGQKYRLAILHPPYHDIIKFSEDARDLSLSADVQMFVRRLESVVSNTLKVLDAGGHIALVIGDKYQNGEIVPLGFMCMNMMLGKPLALKSIVVKNYDSTRGKRGSQDLWKYRALAGGFYLFKHEYVFIFRHRV